MTTRAYGLRASGALFLLACVASSLPVGAVVLDHRPATPQHDAYRNDQLLVKLRPGVSPAAATRWLLGQGASSVTTFRRPRSLSSAPIDSWRLVRLPTLIDVTHYRSAAVRSPDLERVEYDYKWSAMTTPNDPAFGQLWGMENTGQFGGAPDADIDATDAWNVTTGDASIVVAVIDTGIAYDHPDLAANIWTNPGEIPGNGIDDDGNGYVDDVHGVDFANNDSDPYDDFGHGTHCAGTIAAVGNNGIGVVGVAWQARVMAVKFLDANGVGSTSGAIQSVLYAADMGARIMSNSWGGGKPSMALANAISTAD